MEIVVKWKGYFNGKTKLEKKVKKIKQISEAQLI